MSYVTVILVVGFLIAIHECGHLLAAKLCGLRDDREVTVYQSLTDAPDFGRSLAGTVAGSHQYFLFRRGEVPKPRPVPQRRGGPKYHEATGALVAGELQQPLEPGTRTVEMYDVYSTELLRGFQKVGLYWVGPEALRGLKTGQRLVTIGVQSPPEYDLSEA